MLPPYRNLKIFSKIKSLIFWLKSIEQVKFSIKNDFKIVAESKRRK